MIDQVVSFVTEARRLAILWEELWAGALLQHADELNKKVGVPFLLKSSAHKVFALGVAYRAPLSNGPGS